MKIKRPGIIMLLILAIQQPAVADPPDEGRSIFMTRCAACHNVNKVLTGPALAGVDKRHNIEWIISFVHSSQLMVKSGDSAALALFTKFNKVVMPDHADLTPDNIKSIVEYISVESKNAVINTAPFSIPLKREKYYLPVSAHDYVFFGGYIAVILVLAAVLYYAVQVRTLQQGRQGGNASV